MSRLGLNASIVTLLALVVMLAQAANTVEFGVSHGLASEVGVGLGWRPRTPVCADCNVILISIDTLRQDHVGAYGYHRDTTPNVDVFAADAIRFDHAIAHAPSTLPSHASMLTSLIPQHHQAFHAKVLGLPDEAVTMAEIFFDAGYRTAAYVAGGQMRETYNLGQGFDIYDSFKGDESHTTRFSDTVAKAQGFLDQHGDEQFFLFLHTYEVHTPYTPRADYLEMFDPDYDGDLGDEISVDYLRQVFENPVRLRIRGEDRERVVAAYDAEIRSMDDAFGDFIADLKRRGLYDNSIIVFTSDHGEEFGERGRMGWHSWTLYDELLRVPLLIKLPEDRFAGQVVGEVARGIDLLPTLVDLVGIEGSFPFEGQSLMDRVTGRRADAVFAVSQRDLDRDDLPTSIRTTRWKLYDGALYDLAADPMERFDVSEQYPYVKAAMDVMLSIKLAEAALTPGEQVEMDEAARQALRDLGYIQ